MPQLQIVTRAFKIFVVLALILFAAFAVQGSMYFLSEGGASYEGEPININIPPGTSLTRIATILEEEGIVKHALLFRFYARYKDAGQNLQAGDYELFTNMHPADILGKLQEGRVYREQIRFTIPEGLTAEQTAKRLANEGLGDEEVFQNLMASPEDFDYEFFAEIPPGFKYPLKSFLFPNTYFVHIEAGEKEVLNVMLQQFNVFYSESIQERIKDLDFSLHEIITLASIVEKEAILQEEMPLIAGVFYNRLEKRWPLDACSTVNYLLGEWRPLTWYDIRDDPRTQNSYNTYQYRGLPPGPIASPGKSALEAVLYPVETDYMFFVAKDDGTGGHYFAKDNRGHEQNKTKAGVNRQQRNN